jgi:ABC-type polysaccharide/polyol phosphate transport system ATPase subunit
MGTIAPPPSRLRPAPTEQEVLEHFKLPSHSALMRPAYTSIWALEDGTLLWDWKNGFASLGCPLKTVIYLTGPQGSGKSTLAQLMHNAVEIEHTSISGVMDFLANGTGAHETAIITSNIQTSFLHQELREFCKTNKITLKLIKLCK